MNRRQKVPRAKKGSALLAALCFAAVLGIALASYMGVCSQTMQLSNRNSQGTRSLELAENGMEVALWALNKNDWTGWTFDNGASPHVASQTLSGFSFGNGVTGTATITVDNYDGASSLPEYAQDLRKLKVVGQAVLGDGTTVTRVFQASAQRAPLFVNAIAAIGAAGDSSGNGHTGVTFTSGGVLDSFDSVRTGPYGDLDGDGIANIDDDDMDGDGILNVDDDDADGDGTPDIWDTNLYGSAFGYSAVVSSATSVTLTDAQISGYVSTSTNQSGDPRLSYSNGARLVGPTASMSTTIDSSRISTSPYQPTFEIKTPTGTPTAFPALGAGATDIGDASGGATFYTASDVLLSGSQTLKVYGQVVLLVSGNFKIDGNAQMIVKNLTDASGTIIGKSSIQVILTGSVSELSIGGNGILNEAKLPKNVAFFDAATSPYNAPTIALGAGAPDLYAVFYAPNSDREFTIDATVNPDAQFYGSFVAKNVTISGSPTIHYDVDLRRTTTSFSAIETPFVISAWQETTP